MRFAISTTKPRMSMDGDIIVETKGMAVEYAFGVPLDLQNKFEAAAVFLRMSLRDEDAMAPSLESFDRNFDAETSRWLRRHADEQDAGLMGIVTDDDSVWVTYFLSKDELHQIQRLSLGALAAREPYELAVTSKIFWPEQGKGIDGESIEAKFRGGAPLLTNLVDVEIRPATRMVPQ